jgi:hypothetical protein
MFLRIECVAVKDSLIITKHFRKFVSVDNFENMKTSVSARKTEGLRK